MKIISQFSVHQELVERKINSTNYDHIMAGYNKNCNTNHRLGGVYEHPRRCKYGTNDRGTKRNKEYDANNTFTIY